MSSDNRPVAPIKALLWDIDGTLIDTTRLIVSALDHVYRTFTVSTLPTEEIRAIIGIPLREQVALLGPPESFGTTVAAMEDEFIRYYESNRHLETVIVEAVSTLIAGKCAGFLTALVTSKNDEEISNTLPRLGIAEFVDAIVSADQVRNPKPDPEGVLLALERLGTRADDALFIGDTVHDMRAAKAAGVRRCAVTWGAALREILLAEEPELVCERPSDLPSVIGLPDPIPVPFR